jgi:hypothetical protein
MRNQRPWIAAAAAVVLVGAGRSSHLPAAVAKAVEEDRPGATIAKLEVEKDGGLTVYDIEFKDGRGEIEVAEDGTVLDVSDVIDMKDVPSAAAAGIRKAAEGRSIKQVEKSEVHARIEKKDGRGHLSRLASPEYIYEAELSGGEVEVAADGRIVKGLNGSRR